MCVCGQREVRSSLIQGREEGSYEEGISLNSHKMKTKGTIYGTVNKPARIKQNIEGKILEKKKRIKLQRALLL